MTNTVSVNELLARFIYFSRWVRKNQTLKPDAFMPAMNPLETSVTCHDDLAENDIWEIGSAISVKTGRTLHGRADVKTASVIAQKLNVVSQPALPDNPNHAVIIGWPIDKDAQKMLALEISNVAIFVPFS